MNITGPRQSETPRSEPEILPPLREAERDNGPYVQITRISGFKLFLLALAGIALAIALVVTFASVFVVAAVISAIAAGLGIAYAWIRRLFR